MLLKRLFAEFWVRLLRLSISLFLASAGFAGIWFAVYFWHTSIILSLALIIFSLSCIVSYLRLIISEARRVNKEISELRKEEKNG